MASYGQSLRRWAPLFFGLLCGLIASTTLVFAWNRPYNSDSVSLLGSGKGLSALVTTGGTRILIAAGDDPIAFANALASARPMTAPRVDLLIIAPGSERVANRAKDITNPSMVIEIAAADAMSGNNDNYLTRSRESVDIGNEMTLIIDPGITIGSPIPGWSIAIHQHTLEILLVERLPIRQLAGSSLIAVMGDEFKMPGASPAASIAVSSTTYKDPGSDVPFPLGTINPGSSVKIPIEDHSIAIPGSWKPD